MARTTRILLMGCRLPRAPRLLTKIAFASFVVAPLLTLPLAAFAATAPDEFAGVSWTASITEAKRILGQREGVAFKEETPDHLTLEFEGGTFAMHPATRWNLEFPQGVFHRGTVHITIPEGKAADGAPLRNHQFEDFYKSLSEKYGKGVRVSGPRHTQANWNWSVADPRTGTKQAISILLYYSWEPADFKVEYSADAPSHTQSQDFFGKPVKKSDL